MKSIHFCTLTAMTTFLASGFLFTSCEMGPVTPTEPMRTGGSLRKIDKPEFHFAIDGGSAQTRNGDVITLSGEGDLSTQPKGAQGGGSFIFQPASGGSISGTWLVKDNFLIEFNSYGPQGECTQGGRASMRVNFSPQLDGPFSTDGILEIVSTAGSPPSSETAGITLLMQPNIYFKESPNGSVVFTRVPCP